MAILTPDYERMQDGQSVDFETTKEYRNDFKSQDIGSAQALITSDNNYLVMDADKLNDLCDTIDYMQQIWDDDKAEFQSWYLGMTHYSRGSNLIPFPYDYEMVIGTEIEYEINSDSSISAMGETSSSAGSMLIFTDTYYSDISFKAGTYTFKCCPSGGSDSSYNARCIVRDIESQTSVNYYEYGDGVTFTAQGDFDITLAIEIASNMAISSPMTFHPILYDNTIGSANWLPYGQYDPTYTYKTGGIIKYNNNNYFCVVDNTTGTWDETKWARIGSDDVGLDFIGGWDVDSVPPPPASKLYIEYRIFPTLSMILNWRGGGEMLGSTYPNIRYLTSDITPYTGEIYMTDWNGGEGV